MLGPKCLVVEACIYHFVGKCIQNNQSVCTFLVNTTISVRLPVIKRIYLHHCCAMP